ncbi:MAG: tail protein X [Rhodocyclaceae bacterium]|nr:tail protein X [Rhodocyclaceae bacterium]
MAHLIHVTGEGERWDWIAWRYYRDVRQVPALIAANPHAPLAPILPAGLKLRVPLIARASQTAALPPWRR